MYAVGLCTAKSPLGAFILNLRILHALMKKEKKKPVFLHSPFDNNVFVVFLLCPNQESLLGYIGRLRLIKLTF